MFSATNSSKVTAACVVAIMMMMMITEAAAMPKTGRPHSHGATLKTVSLQLDAKTLETHRHTRLLNNASISPWTYNVTTDDTLFPPFLSEAHCLLQGCLNSQGQEDRNLESRPIMHQVLLLRRIRPEGSADYHYRLESRLISVGCTCVKPVVRIQQ
ncbi:interleukin-17F-like [Pelmatolapia mariae]|uniref:interleukin-17F-like n=1 Tax=Pelmatolapia mariae TaxID=158779 RepID=UPI002FE539FE